MGDPKRLDRQYDIPRLKWNTQKIKSDKNISAEYGLKTKKEIWKAETEVRKLRKKARLLLAGRVDDYSTRKNELLNKLVRLGIFTKEHKVEDVLKLNASDLLDRRLQTLVFRKGLALTPNQARQLIVHGHVAVNGKKRKIPGSLVNEKDSISYLKTNMKNNIERMLDQKGKPVAKPETKTEAKKEEKGE